MENLYLFFTTALTALAVENAIFARSLGLSKGVLFINRSRTGILYGALLTWTVTWSSVLVSILDVLLRRFELTQFTSFPIYLLCVVIVYTATYFACRQWLPALFGVVRRALPLTTFNSALFGAFYVAAIQNYGFLQTVGYALGTGVGYTLAIQIIYFARKRLAISPVPRSFRGLPVLLVYIGLLSLAIYGLIGHGLPT